MNDDNLSKLWDICGPEYITEHIRLLKNLCIQSENTQFEKEEYYNHIDKNIRSKRSYEDFIAIKNGNKVTCYNTGV